MSSDPFYFGKWQILPNDNTISSDSGTRTVEPKAMDVLVELCSDPGAVQSSDILLARCWGNAPMGDNPVHKAINQLRRALGDSASNPTYIETIRKRGYKTLAPVKRSLNRMPIPCTWEKGSPYAGLSAFKAEQSQVFYGRDRHIQTLLDRIVTQVNYGRAFCLVLGRSGCGKSSLIQAGVLPALSAPQGYKNVKVVSESCIDLADVALEHFWQDFASSIIDWEIDQQPIFDQWSAAQLASLLQDDEGILKVITHCDQALQRHSASNLQPVLALFIDRLEAVLDDGRIPKKDQLLIIALIEKFSESGVILTLSACRNDYYPQLAQHASLMAGKANGAHFDLEAPGRAELMDIIRKPALAAGLTWETDPASGSSLDELICTQASAGEDVLPLLQYTLQELYILRDGNKLTIEAYNSLGGIEGALSQKAESTVAKLTAPERDALPNVLSLLINMAADESTVTCRAVRWSKLTNSHERSLVQALVDERLFVSFLMAEEPCFSVAHESIIRHWTRATQWLEEHKESLKVKARLLQSAQRWHKEGQNSAYLLSNGKPLQEAIAIRNNTLFQLSDVEQLLVTNSEKKVNKLRFYRTAIGVALCCLSATSLYMAHQSNQAQSFAQEKRQEAESLMGFMVGEFSEKLRTLGRMDLLDGISNKALEYFTNSSGNSDNLTVKARTQYAQTIESIGEVALSRGKNDEANEALLTARTLFRNLLDENPKDFDLLRQLGANAFWLSTIPYNQADYDTAEEYVREYLYYSNEMYKIDDNSLEAVQELSYANNTLGTLAFRKNQFPEATDYFTQSLNLKLKALTLSPEDTLLITDLASTYSWLSSSALSTGDAQKSMDYLRQEQALLNQLKDSSHNNSQTDFEQALSFYREALLLKDQNEPRKALERIRLSARILLDLNSSDPSNAQWAITRLRVDTLHINLLSQIKPQTIPNDLQSLEARVDHFLTESNFDSVIQKINLMLEISQVHQNYGNWSQSKKWQADISHLLASSDLQLDNNLRLANALHLLLDANIAKLSGRQSRYREYCLQAQKIIEPLTHVSSEPKYLIPYAKSLYCLNQPLSFNDLDQRLAKLGIVEVKP